MKRINSGLANLNQDDDDDDDDDLLSHLFLGCQQSKYYTIQYNTIQYNTIQY